MTPRGRYLGSWVLPSGNNADVYLTPSGLECQWDREPSPSWPRADVEHWLAVAFPETALGQRVLGVSA
jgi:hypothetical protein